MEIDSAIYESPKRKRGQATPGPRLVTSGLSQGLTLSEDQLEEKGNNSPSTRVTGKFQKLDLRSSIDLSSSSSPVTELNLNEERPPEEPTTTVERGQASPDPAFKPPEAVEFTFESPVLKSASLVSSTPTSASGRAKSPPPSSVVSDQFWHASEITGWSPDDPDEDYYGVNGVGYAKPAGKAWAISQKRKQQIADYRSRETREARQRRHERRLSGLNSRRGSPRASPKPISRQGSGGQQPEQANASGERKSVRFTQCEAA